MSSHVVSLCALLVLSAAAVAGAEPEVGGQYAVQGRSARSGEYVGTARLDVRPAADGERLRLTVTRDLGAGSARGELRRRGEDLWEMRAEWNGPGLAGALVGLHGQEELPLVLQAQYRRTERGFSGRWRLRQGSRTLDRGLELLVRPQRAVAAVHLTVSVDWEGRDLSEANLRAMERLREALPDVPLTQFLNGAYFTKPGADPARIAERIRRALRPGDELGVHVHGWRSLFTSAGVEFRKGPTFWSESSPLHPTSDGDLGHEVEIGAYTVMELRAVLSHSRELLTEAGFSTGGSFRAGGWMATPNVLEAIRAEGFSVDSSATCADWHDELAGMRLQRRIREVWSGVSPLCPPYTIPTRAGTVLEMPDTCALADYVTVDEMVAHVRAALRRFELDPSRDLFVHVGFHQETAARYADRIVEAIRRLRAEPNANLVIETLETAAKRALAQLEEANAEADEDS